MKMLAARMNLKILLPYKIFAEHDDVESIVAMTDEGAFGILPNRLDCVAPLPAGILTFMVKGEAEAYVAVDEGVLVKSGADVRVSVRSAIGGMALDQLRDAVEQEFLQLDEQAQNLRSVLVKMETGFVRRVAALHQGKDLL